MSRFTFLFLLLCFLPACATSPTPSVIGLNEMLNKKDVISLPIRMSEEGLIMLDDVRVGDGQYRFILDTGATQSAIFETSFKQTGLNTQSDVNTTVHGMIQSEERQVVKVSKFGVGPLNYIGKNLVVLHDRDLAFGISEPFDGLIGMDILSSYQVYVSPKNSELKLIPSKTQVSVPGSWDRIELADNPFKDDNRALHFFDVRIAGRLSPALIDTGAEFSVINWNAARFSQLKSIKRNLRKEWELQGAIGTFKPVAKVTLAEFRSGQKFWDDKEFVVMDFDGLQILGLTDEPFLIVGMNIFKDETFLIDFERNYMALKPKGKGRYFRNSYYEPLP